MASSEGAVPELLLLPVCPYPVYPFPASPQTAPLPEETRTLQPRFMHVRRYAVVNLFNSHHNKL
jgi:hypothetical protein